MPGWLRNYRRELLPGDIGAGIIVALLMVPQGMAYAIVAGLSPITGLYASILPPLAYALFGTSMTQSVGPQAITALLVAGVLAPLALPASPEYVLLAARLALLTGLILLACGLLRLGFLVNYLSQPVMSGFTNGAVLLIAAGQVPSLLGPADLGIPLVGEVPTGLPPIGFISQAGPGGSCSCPPCFWASSCSCRACPLPRHWPANAMSAWLPTGNFLALERQILPVPCQVVSR